MHITDPIADMLTRIRNANSAKHETVDIPASNMKKAIAQILLDEGYIASYKVIEDDKQGVIRVTLKYGENKSQVITGLRRVSKPGLRIYSNVEDMPKVMKGLGIAIVSTSKGIMTDREARKQNVRRKYKKTRLNRLRLLSTHSIFTFLFHNHSFTFKLSLSLHDFEKEKIKKNRFYD